MLLFFFFFFFWWSIVIANHVDDLKHYIIRIEAKLVEIQEVLISTNLKKQTKVMFAMRVHNQLEDQNNHLLEAK
jgi:hypothetical protein